MASFRARSRSLSGRLKRTLRRHQGGRRTLRDQARWDKNLIHSLSRTRLPTWRQVRHLPEVLSSNDSLRLKLGSLMLVTGLAILGVSFYFANTAIVPGVGGEIREGVVGTPRSLNPILSVSNDVDRDLTELMFSSLFDTDEKGQIIPELVDHYLVSDDQKAYTLSIHEGVEWHDGHPLTAADVVFTVSLIQDPAWKSPLHPIFKDIAVEQESDTILKFVLKEPFAPFLSKLRFGILPRHIWKDILPQNALMSEYNLKPIGSGPYRFLSLKRDKRGFVLSYTLERNKDYFREPPFIEKLAFEFYPDYPTAIEALRKRQVDSLSFVPRDLRQEVTEMAHVLPISLELPQYSAVFFNQTKNPILKDKAVRQALIMAIDKSRVLFDVLGGDGRPLDGPPIPGYNDLSNGSLSYDLFKAREILEEQGWEIDSDDGIRKKAASKDDEEPTPLQLTLTTVNQPENMTVASIIKEGWSSIGVDVSINAVPSSDIHRTVIKPREYEALLISQLLETDLDPYPFWHSSQTKDPGLNLAMFANRDADTAIEAARKTTDLNVRKEKYKSFLQILMSELPAAFLYSPSYTYPIPETMQGFEGDRISIPSDRFTSITSWYLETKRAWR